MNKYLILTNSLLYQHKAETPQEALEDALQHVQVGIEVMEAYGDKPKRLKHIATYNATTKRFEL